MKYILFVGCLLISHVIYSQSNSELHRIKPNWKLGDQKKVHTESVAKIFIKDSLFNTTEAKGNYTMKVIDTVEVYTLSYYNEPQAIDIETKSSDSKTDSAVNIFTRIIKKIEKETDAFEYELLVDKNTGQAFQVKNGDKYLDVIERVTSRIIDELGAKKGKTNSQIDSMKKRVVGYFKLVKPKILETAINQFNYIMQPYSYEFKYESTVSYKTMIHDVNALGEFGDIEMPAVLTISSKQHNKLLTITSDTNYDKDFLLEQIKKKHKSMSNLAASDIFCNERVETVFATQTSWIISHKANVVFEMKEVKVHNEAMISFQ
jgi:hypothetical protein